MPDTRLARDVSTTRSKWLPMGQSACTSQVVSRAPRRMFPETAAGRGHRGNWLTPVPTVHHKIKRTGILRPQFPRHARELRRISPDCQLQGLTPWVSRWSPAASMWRMGQRACWCCRRCPMCSSPWGGRHPRRALHSRSRREPQRPHPLDAAADHERPHHALRLRGLRREALREAAQVLSRPPAVALHPSFSNSHAHLHQRPSLAKLLDCASPLALSPRTHETRAERMTSRLELTASPEKRQRTAALHDAGATAKCVANSLCGLRVVSGDETHHCH